MPRVPVIHPLLVVILSIHSFIHSSTPQIFACLPWARNRSATASERVSSVYIKGIDIDVDISIYIYIFIKVLGLKQETK